MKRFKLLLLGFLLSSYLPAQITFSAKQPENKKDWEYMKEIILLPYDSSRLFIETYPIIEAYQKYIGQQVFFMKGSDESEDVTHKYFEIIDVISYKGFLEDKFQKEESEWRDKEKSLKMKLDQINDVEKELQSDYALKESIFLIDRELYQIEKTRSGKVNKKVKNELDSKELKLREEKAILQQKYKRKDEIGGDFFDDEYIASVGNISNGIRENEELRRKRTYHRLVEIESENIRKELRKIEEYFEPQATFYRELNIENLQGYNGSRLYFFPCDDKPHQNCRYVIEDEDLPCFVLRDIQSMDTIYRTIPTVDYSSRESKSDYRAKDEDHGVVLVGGFVKLQSNAIDQNYIFWSHSMALEPEVRSVWKCIDVSITAEDDYMSYHNDNGRSSYSRNSNRNNDDIITLTLQNNKNPDLVDFIKYSTITNNVGIDFIYGSMDGPVTNESKFKEYEFAWKQQKLDRRKLTIQENNKRKQHLTDKFGKINAEKIIAGKFEIGMSKAVCKEIAIHVTITDKTATSEIWNVSNILWGNFTYLFFEGDKLVRIVNY